MAHQISGEPGQIQLDDADLTDEQRALTRALGGRPSLDPAARPGTRSPVRNVRLPQQMSEQLDRVAQAQGRNPSDVIRDALTSYLTTHA